MKTYNEKNYLRAEKSTGTAIVPQVRLHGFPAPRAAGFIVNYLKQENISQESSIIFEREFRAIYGTITDPETGVERPNPEYHTLLNSVNKFKMDLKGRGDPRLLFLLEADLIVDQLNVSRFVTRCSWSNLTSPPYSNGQITLQMPEFLALLLLHGKVSDYAVNPDDDNFAEQKETIGKAPRRDIEAGGWVSVSNAENITIFFGKILALTKANYVTASGSQGCIITMTLSNAIYPLIASSYARTTNEHLSKKGIDQGAISHVSRTETLSTDGQPRVGGVDPISTIVDVIQNNTAPEALKKFLEFFAYEEFPLDSIRSLKIINGELAQGRTRLSDVLGVDNGLVSAAYSTQTSQKFDSLERINLSIQNYLPVASQLEQQSVWGLIRSIFQADPDIIELFPIMLPVPAKNVVDSENDSSLGTMFAIVYRLKPMQPDFDGGVAAINRKFPISRRIYQTNMELYFGERDDIISNNKVFEGGKDGDWRIISKDIVINQELTWDDTNHVNFLSVHIPDANAAALVDQLAVALDTSVFNRSDINRNGLRMTRKVLPFRVKGVLPQTLASAFSERLYYTIGEGKSFASGTIKCGYIEDPLLLCGIWVLIDYEIPLTGYVEAVSHDISVDGATGIVSGTTKLTLSRVSYAGKVPYITDTKTLSPSPSETGATQNPARTEVRPPNNPAAPAPVPQPGEAAPRAAATTDPAQPAAQDPQAPQAFTKGGTSATPTQRATGKDPARRRKTVSKTPPNVPTPADPKVPGGTAKSRRSRTTARPQITQTQIPAAPLFNGDLPEKPRYSAFLHYDDPTVLPLGMDLAQVQASGGNVQVQIDDSSVISIVQTAGDPALFMPQGTDFYTAYAFRVAEYRAAQGDGGSFYKINYEDGAVGIVYVIFGANGDVVETRRFAFARGPVRGQVTRARATVLPDRTVLDFDISLPQSDPATPFDE